MSSTIVQGPAEAGTEIRVGDPSATPVIDHGTEPRRPQDRDVAGWIRARLPTGGLWRHADFLNLWAAETVSQLGTQLTLLALPLAAALTLDASAAQMGLLTAAGSAPVLCFGLAAGVWVDRLRRRPILIAADLGRAALLALIPVLWVLDALRIEALYAVEIGRA